MLAGAGFESLVGLGLIGGEEESVRHFYPYGYSSSQRLVGEAEPEVNWLEMGANEAGSNFRGPNQVVDHTHIMSELDNSGEPVIMLTGGHGSLTGRFRPEVSVV